ncbi:thiamine phosphate synthase [Paenibacillus gansuensis]|uniref:Thiamine phosphate synthase n=1 Tax=Paenibacillus gansuensis TaxID=306542 RepID=A0ABW5P829_9BACL
MSGVVWLSSREAEGDSQESDSREQHLKGPDLQERDLRKKDSQERGETRLEAEATPRSTSGLAELHVVSDGKQPWDRLIRIAAEIAGDVTAIHLREPQAGAAMLCELAGLMIAAGVPAAKIIVNGRADVAWAMQAGGVQLGHRSISAVQVRERFPGLRIGRSVHRPEEAAEAAALGADYVLYGHVYATQSKPGQPGRGLRELCEAAQRASVPVIAIGGIAPEHAAELLDAGAAGIAVMSGIWGAADPAAAAADYRAALDEVSAGRWMPA